MKGKYTTSSPRSVQKAKYYKIYKKYITVTGDPHYVNPNHRNKINLSNCPNSQPHEGN
jgi:hypothetical protein